MAEEQNTGPSQTLNQFTDWVSRYKNGNEGNRPSIVAEIKNSLLNLDRQTVAGLFDKANALRNKPDTEFKLAEGSNITIPKTLFTEALGVSKTNFLSDYDRVNFGKEQAAAEEVGKARAEGAATKAEAAKQAILGTGLGAIGAAAAGLVGIKTGQKPKTESKTTKKAAETPAPMNVEKPESAAPQASAEPTPTIEEKKIVEEEEAEGSEEPAIETREATSEEQAEAERADNESRIDEVLAGKLNLNAYPALQRQRGSQELAPALLAWGEKAQRHEERSTLLNARLQTAQKNFDDLKGKQHAQDKAQRQNFKSQIKSLQSDIRQLEANWKANSQKSLDEMAAQATKMEAEVQKEARKEATAEIPVVQDKDRSAFFSAVELGRQFNQIADSLQSAPDPFANGGATFYEIRRLKKQVTQANTATPSPELKNLYDKLDLLGSEYREGQGLARQGKDGRASLLSSLDQIQTINAPLAQSTVNVMTPVLTQSDALVYRVNDFRIKTAVEGKTNDAERTVLLKEIDGLSNQIQQQIAIGGTDNKRLAALKDTLNEIRTPLGSPTVNEFPLDDSLKRYGDIRKMLGPAVGTTHLIQSLDNTVRKVSAFNGQVATNGLTPELAQQKQDLLKDVRTLSSEYDKHTRLFDSHDPALQQRREVLRGFSQPLSGTTFTARDQNNLGQALNSFSQIPHIALPAAMLGIGAAAMAGTAASSAGSTISQASMPLKVEVEGKTNVEIEAPFIPPPPAAAASLPPGSLQVPIEVQAQVPMAHGGRPTEGQPFVGLAPVPNEGFTLPQPAARQPFRMPAVQGPAIQPTAAAALAATPKTGVRVGRRQPGAPTKMVVRTPGTTVAPRGEVSEPAAEENLQPEETQENPNESAQEPVRGASTPMGAPEAMAIVPPMAGLAARPAMTGITGFAPATRRAPGPARGYKSVGPQEIKPPIGRGLEINRASRLQAAQTAAGREMGPEGLELSQSGWQSALESGTEAEPSLPVEYGQFFNPMEHRGPASFTPQYLGPGSMAEEPELEAEEAEGGTPENEIERLQRFQAQQLQSALTEEQLVGAPQVGRPAPAQMPQQGTWAGAQTQGPRPRAEESYTSQLSTALQLRGQQMQLAKVQQGKMEQIEQLKASIESLQKAKQTFKNLWDVGEIAASESGVTLLTLWGEWNVDLINKHVLQGALPWFEKKPSEKSDSLTKAISAIKDGTTIFLNFVGMISIFQFFILALAIVVVILVLMVGSTVMLGDTSVTSAFM